VQNVKKEYWCHKPRAIVILLTRAYESPHVTKIAKWLILLQGTSDSDRNTRKCSAQAFNSEGFSSNLECAGYTDRVFFFIFLVALPPNADTTIKLAIVIVPLGVYIQQAVVSLLIKNIKIKIYRTAILSLVLYGCKPWSLKLREERRLRLVENRVFGRIFGPKRGQVTGECSRLHNGELYGLYYSPNIIQR